MELPLYVSPIAQTIADQHGNSQDFEAGVPAFVARPLVEIALTAGIVQEGVGIYTDSPAEEDAPGGPDLSLVEIADGIRKLMEAGDPKAFTVDGEPKLAQLRKVLGAAVTDAQRDAAWELVKSEA